MMTIERWVRVGCAATVFAALVDLPLAASAGPTPLPAQVRSVTGAAQPRRATGPVGQTVRPQPVTLQTGPMRNAVYGTVAAVAGGSVTLRTRSGQLRTIDASAALAAGTVSIPLYIGKPVVAEGVRRVDGVLVAARITRLTRLDQTNPDR